MAAGGDSSGVWATALAQKPINRSGSSNSIKDAGSVPKSGPSNNATTQTESWADAGPGTVPEVDEEFNWEEVRHHLHKQFQAELARAQAVRGSTVIYKLLELNHPWQVNEKSGKDKSRRTKFNVMAEINKSLAKRPPANRFH